MIESAASGRAKCRGCGEPVAKGSLRFGERLPNPFGNPFGDGEMTLWFHLQCAAYKRPEPFLEALAAMPDVADAERLRTDAEAGIGKHRLPRLSGAERAPSGRARCRACREPIEKRAWRVPLVFYAEGMFNPGGYIHAACAPAYVETADLLPRLCHFARDLSDDDLACLGEALKGSRG